jgi:hypothetical protein
MTDFVGGMIAMGYLVGALFFFRYWVRSGDTLFLVFAGSFLLLAIGPIAMVVLEIAREENSWVYLLRVAAFTLIIVAIVRKNVEARR